MRPVSYQLLAIMPAIMALLLLLVCSTPLNGGSISLTPNIAWLMTLVMVTHYSPVWPREFAFFIGLLQDILFTTPLGSQALLTVLLAQLTLTQAHRHQTQLFRLRWLESAGMLIIWHILLWALMHLVSPESANLRHLIQAGLVNALWYPVFYWGATRAFAALPDAK